MNREEALEILEKVIEREQFMVKYNIDIDKKVLSSKGFSFDTKETRELSKRIKNNYELFTQLHKFKEYVMRIILLLF